MTERYSFQKPASGNCSAEILRTKSAGTIDIDDLDEIKRALGHDPKDFIDTKYENKNLRPAKTLEEMIGGFYLKDR